MMRRLLLCLVLSLIVCPRPLQAQQQPADTLPDPSAQPHTGTALTLSDTTGSSPAKSKSPGTAILLSAVLPGAGQAYNGSYWKVPIVLGLGLYFVSEWLNYNRLTMDYREKYNGSMQQNPSGDPRLYARREFYKTERDAFAWYFLVLYVLNIVDAYVDASLSGFDVGEELAIRFGPHAGRWEVRLQF
jgi:hypothetical protein